MGIDDESSSSSSWLPPQTLRIYAYTHLRQKSNHSAVASARTSSTGLLLFFPTSLALLTFISTPLGLSPLFLRRLFATREASRLQHFQWHRATPRAPQAHVRNPLWVRLRLCARGHQKSRQGVTLNVLYKLRICARQMPDDHMFPCVQSLTLTLTY